MNQTVIFLMNEKPVNFESFVAAFSEYGRMLDRMKQLRKELDK